MNKATEMEKTLVITWLIVLLNEYRQQVDFAVIVISSKRYTAQEIQDNFDIGAPVFFDDSIANSCGGVFYPASCFA